MRTLLEVRERLRQLYGNYSLFINKAIQLILAFAAFYGISNTIGYFSIISNPVILAGMSLICMLLPVNITVFVAGILMIANLYKLSLVIMGVTAAFLVIMYAFYLSVSPRYAVVLLLVPILFGLKIPYALPLVLGLSCTPLVVFASACGVFVYYLIGAIVTYAGTFGKNPDESMLESVKNFVLAVIKNKEMYITIIIFSVVIILVYAIRRLSVDYAWLIAIGVGLVINFAGFAIGGAVMNVDINYGMLILGSALSLIIAVILNFFVFMVDYSRTKRVQYEDDEYYYYVKAVPKVSVSMEDKQVKKFRHWKEDQRGEEE
ncbi:MAG: hypothetical protein PUF77_02355 [Clostridiales bacterium]|nr:hypothetical protein [Clostridiales bacterium]